MKKSIATVIILLSLILLSLSASAQIDGMEEIGDPEEAPDENSTSGEVKESPLAKLLFNEDKFRYGGMAVLFMNMGPIDNEFGLKLGAGAALVLNNKLYIGGYGLGLSTEHNRAFDTEFFRLGYTEGGAWFGRTFKPDHIIHYSLGAQIGFGTGSIIGTKPFSFEDYTYASDQCVSLSPNVALHIRLVRHIRFAVSAQYRIPVGFELERVDSSALFGPGVQLGIQAGIF